VDGPDKPGHDGINLVEQAANQSHRSSMSLKIRMARAGAKKRPFYQIVVADSRSPRDGRFIEKLGTYNPMLTKEHPDRIKLKTERIQHWLGVGALPSERVARFLGEAGLREKPAIRETPKRSAPRKKTQEREAGAPAAPATATPAAPAAGATGETASA